MPFMGEWGKTLEDNSETISKVPDVDVYCCAVELIRNRQICRIVIPPAADGQPLPASALAFDTQQELLWVGNEAGRITAFHGSELARYTSIRAHPSQTVRQFLFHDRGVISVATNSVHLGSRNGLTQWHIENAAMQDLRCMTFLRRENVELLVAGNQETMYRIDIEKGCIVEEIWTVDKYLKMTFCRYICAGTSTGCVNFIDPTTLEVISTWKAHLGYVHDMDARNNYLVTCGLSDRPSGPPVADYFAKVYDLRSMTALPPLSFQAGASFVQLHPKMSTTSIVASHRGQLQVTDLMNSNVTNIRYVDSSQYGLTGLVIAPTGQAWAIADGDSSIHLWASTRDSSSNLQFAELGKPTEVADEPAPPREIDTNTDMPLNYVGMPYYREKLLSAWPATELCEVGKSIPKLDADIEARLTQLRTGHMVFSKAPNPRKHLRNQIAHDPDTERKDTALATPRFLSEKARHTDSDPSSERRMSDVVEALANVALAGSTKEDVPVMYRNVEIKYSKFGVDDFDFQYYNKTDYSGLETHISNSYSNPLLQLYRFTPLIRNMALHHAASNCLTEHCLLCEMGFLFDMLEKAEGQNCQATNFLKTFSSIPEAAKCQLLEEHSPANPLTAMIQSANRFLLERINYESRSVSVDTAGINQTLAADALSTIRCLNCHNETRRSSTTYVHDLLYQPLNTNPRIRPKIPTFSQILQASIEPQTQTRGYCDRCKRYCPLAIRKTTTTCPFVLLINAALKTAEAREYWATPGWLPAEIGMVILSGGCCCYEGEELRLQKQRNNRYLTLYELVGFVADVDSGEHQKPHLVSLVNVAIAHRDPQTQSQWHLFNDFLVRKISSEEALHFAKSWKVPAVISYQIQSASHTVDDSWKETLDTTLLYYRMPSYNSDKTLQGLNAILEGPIHGAHVAIDSEFVALQQEEIEIKADGSREIIRPTRLGLARVSVLRGSGVDEGIPFINDYITITEPVVDYLTKYSGLETGDLDPRFSTHDLIPLKFAYKKLWLLLNLGCIFVGHGLPKDFRTINIHVPKSQVLDTVDLFFIRARQRKLSLRFLAWYLLQEDIQQETHDSIEDARTALRLWKKYEEFHDAGIIDRMLEKIYKDGKKYAYKPPSEQAGGKAENKGMDVASLGGRDTPPILQALSGPVTPAGRRAVAGRESEYFESPLR